MTAHNRSAYLAAGTSEGELHLWNGENGAALRSLCGHAGAVNHTDFTPDGRFLLSCGDDSALRKWKLSAGRSVVEFCGPRFHQSPVLSFACHAQRALLVSAAADGSFALSNHETGDVYHRATPRPAALLACALAPQFSKQTRSLRAGRRRRLARDARSATTHRTRRF